MVSEDRNAGADDEGAGLVVDIVHSVLGAALALAGSGRYESVKEFHRERMLKISKSWKA